MNGSLTQVQAFSRAPDRGRIDRVWRGLRRLAWLGAAMTFGVLVLAAAMRLQSAGVGCEPWPACRALAGAATDSPLWVRMTHRVVATLVALCALAIVVVAFRRAPHCRLPRARAVLTLVGVAGLAILGRASGAGAPPVVLLGNLLGGLALLAVFVSMAQSRPYDDAGGVSTSSRWDLGWVIAALVSGAVASTFGASEACGGSILCGLGSGGAGGPVWANLLHRVIAIVLIARLATACLRGADRGRMTLAWIVAAQGMAGLWQSIDRASLAAALVHHSLSAISLVAAMQVAAMDRDRVTVG
ncbi:MAG: hypothetical protein U1F52_17080 [Burkholderiales bacterium]